MKTTDICRIAWIAVLSMACLPLSAQTGKSDFPTDMVLIYSGGAHRSGTWDKERFEPYVSLTEENGKESWLFDGFLFLEIKNGKGRGFASYYEKDGARKQEWEDLLNQYFSPGRNICALNDCVGEARRKVSGKFNKRKIVIGLPEPIPDQKDWGEIDGRQLDFSNKEDRMAAVSWFIDRAILKSKDARLKHVELAGFYWIAEEATNSRTLAADVGAYVRDRKMSFNWIPYFKSDGYREWKTLGFDIAYLQPNYFFNADIPFSRLTDACKLAEENGMCMEMEFDERALKAGGFSSRLEDYIKAFEMYGVFGKLPVAYYQGNIGFYSLFHSEEPEDRWLYMRLARIIAGRQCRK